RSSRSGFARRTWRTRRSSPRRTPMPAGSTSPWTSARTWAPRCTSTSSSTRRGSGRTPSRRRSAARRSRPPRRRRTTRDPRSSRVSPARRPRGKGNRPASRSTPVACTSSISTPAPRSNPTVYSGARRRYEGAAGRSPVRFPVHVCPAADDATPVPVPRRAARRRLREQPGEPRAGRAPAGCRPRAGAAGARRGRAPRPRRRRRAVDPHAVLGQPRAGRVRRHGGRERRGSAGARRAPGLRPRPARRDAPRYRRARGGATPRRRRAHATSPRRVPLGPGRPRRPAARLRGRRARLHHQALRSRGARRATRRGALARGTRRERVVPPNPPLRAARRAFFVTDIAVASDGQTAEQAPSTRDRGTAVQRRARIALATMLALLVALAAVAAFATDRLYSSAQNRYIEEAFPLRSYSRDLLIQMLNKETSVRSYMITANPGSLGAYDAALPAARADLAGLRRLTQRRPEIAAEVRNATALVRSLDDYFRKQIALVGSGHKGQLKAQTNVLDGLARFGEFRATANALQRDADRILADAEHNQHRTFWRTLVFVLFVAVAAIAIGAALLARLPSRVGSLYRREEEARRAAERGDQAARSLGHVEEAVILLDHDGTVRYWNPAAVENLGVPEH